VPLTALVAAFIVWAETPLGPMPEALAALESDSHVAVETGKWLVFSPVSANASTALIIYPGGRIDPRSYAPEARAIAANGYLVIIVPMPLNLAVFGAGSGENVIESHPEIRRWAVGGHSLGGVMAAQFAFENPARISGLVLWAAYPSAGNDLSTINISVTTIHGTSDGLVSRPEIDNSLRLLPADTVRDEIEGGNHAQFGWYGKQPKDNEATISRESQQDEVVAATSTLLRKITQE
jgi:hypothetical protein